VIQIEKFQWLVVFNAVDRSQIFKALREIGKESLDEAVFNASLTFDEDPETINTSVEVHSLEDLRKVLNATSSVSSLWGNGIYFIAETAHWSLSASLLEAEADKKFATQSCSMSPRLSSKESDSEILNKIVAAENALNDLRDEFRKAQAARAC